MLRAPMRWSTIRDTERFDIVGMSFSLVERVTQWAEQARRFFYAVMLWDHTVPAAAVLWRW